MTRVLFCLINIKLSIIKAMNPKTKEPNLELTFLIVCCKYILLEKERKWLLTTLKSKNLKYEILIGLAYKHAVLPLLYKTLKSLVPKHPLTTLLKPYYMGIVQKNMSMTVQLLHIISLLKMHNIASLSFKGVVLSQHAYGDITLRQYGDLDILIQNKNKEKMLTLLKKEGYEPEIKLLDSRKETFLNAVNVLGFKSPSEDTFIEVHWELLSKNYAIHWEEKELWKNADSLQINTHTLNTLCFEDTLLYLCTHGSKHLFERLSWVCDIDRTVRSNKDIDWETLFYTSDALGITRMLLLSLHLAQKLLDLPLAMLVEEKLHQDKTVKKLANSILSLHFSIDGTQGKSYSTFKLLSDMRKTPFEKIRFIYFALFSAKFDDFKFIQLPPYLAFLYPIIRPIRLALKYFK